MVRAEVIVMDKVSVGRRGEDLAAAHLERLGWSVLDRNWRCRAGEIDLVAVEPGQTRGDTVVFCEVKCRTGLGYGDPLEAITRVKLQRLRDLAQWWLRAHQAHPDRIRLDAIGVLLRGPSTGLSTITHVRGLG